MAKKKKTPIRQPTPSKSTPGRRRQSPSRSPPTPTRSQRPQPSTSRATPSQQPQPSTSRATPSQQSQPSASKETPAAHTPKKHSRKSITPPKKNTKRRKGLVQYISNNIRATCTFNMMRTLRFYQNSTHNLIPKLPFSRLVKEIFQQHGRDYRIQKEALEALQDVCETYITDLFMDASKCAGHAKRVTVMPKDFRLALDIRGVADPGFLQSGYWI